MRKIIVTEDNFEKVLEKLQKICNKYKMLEFYRALSEDTKEVKYKTNPIGFRRELNKEWIDKSGKHKYTVKKKLFMHSNYVCVTKHSFRIDYENDKESYNAKYAYPEMKPLIHLSLAASCALVICAGDKVQFTPFGGFIVWTDDNYTVFDNPLTIYKHIYIPDLLMGKIKNLEHEKETREKELEEEDTWLNKQYEKDMELEMNEYNEYME